jgi:hypothetical protein
LLGAVGEVKEKGVDWLNVEGLFGVDPALDADCEKGLLVGAGPPNANEVDVVVGAATGACPKANPPADDVGTASAGFWPKEKPEDVFWPKPLNPRPLLSCFSSVLVANILAAGVLGAPPNRNGDAPR